MRIRGTIAPLVPALLVFPVILTLGTIGFTCKQSLESNRDRLDLVAPLSEERTYYITARVLNARAEPALKSRRVFQLPYGSRVRTIRQKQAQVIRGTKDYWHYIPDVRGYVFGAYLSERSPEKGRKKYRLRLSSDYSACASEYVTRKATLELYNHKAVLRVKEQAFYTETRGTQRGEYKIKKGRLYIRLGESRGKYTQYSPGEEKTIRLKPVKFELGWSERARGLLSPEEFKTIRQGGHYVNRKACIIVPATYRAYSDKLKLCEDHETARVEFRGYFCAP